MAEYKNLEKYTYEYLMSYVMERVRDDVDKREGSIIYDSIAPAMYQLAEVILHIHASVKSAFIPYAGGEDLDNLAIVIGAERYKATYAVLEGEFTDKEGNPVAIQRGMRFSALDAETPINYTVGEKIGATTWEMIPDEIGIAGNVYLGNLIALQDVPNLSTARITKVLTLARDEETDELFRERVIATANRKPFGGNVADYDRVVRELSNVGEVQIYPTWDGGGTVLLSIVNAEYSPLTPTQVSDLQERIDPSPQGTGVGLAPIGHTVTVRTPTEQEITISGTVALLPSYTLGQVLPEIQEKVQAYINELRERWGVPDDMNNYNTTVYRSRILSAIVSVEGVDNVSNMRINGEATDLTLEQSSTTQIIPKYKEVNLVV